MGSATQMLAGRYRLEARIAAGGVGEVWRGWDAVLLRAVAVKLLRSEYAGHQETLARFRAEARHAGSLPHPGIAQVYDYGEDGQPFLVMELVDGPALSTVLRRGPLDAATALDLVAQTASALAAAHAAGLVHRDVKPANLLLAPGGHVKVTDFGIAYAVGSAPLTGTGTLIGTPAYLAPERVEGRPATPASDLYSLGIVCWECLTGAPPFTGTQVEVAMAHSRGQLPPLGPMVPAEVAALVTSLTARDPSARPASASDAARLATGLREALAPGGTAPQGGWPVPPPAAPADPPPATLVTAQHLPSQPRTTADTQTAVLADPGREAGRWPQGGRFWLRGRARRGRMLVLAAAGAGVVAVLAGWLALGGNGPARHPAGPPPVSASSSAPPPAEVSQAALAGQPVSVVRRQLQHAGLRVHVTWQVNGHQKPGTVTSVQPTGRVPAGTTVVVSAVKAPPGHGGQGDGGNGHGNGNGGQG